MKLLLNWSVTSNNCEDCGWSDYIHLAITNMKTNEVISEHFQDDHTGNDGDLDLFGYSCIPAILKELGIEGTWDYAINENADNEIVDITLNGEPFVSYESDDCCLRVEDLLVKVLQDLKHEVVVTYDRDE